MKTHTSKDGITHKIIGSKTSGAVQWCTGQWFAWKFRHGTGKDVNCMACLAGGAE